MKLFAPGDEDRDDVDGARGVATFLETLFDILVPKSGACMSIQGELIRAAAILGHEYRANEMALYYVRPEYRGLAAFAMDVVLANKGKIAAPRDLDALATARSALDDDFAVGARRAALQDRNFAGTITRAEKRQLERLERVGDSLDWDETVPRLTRCAANWCLVHHSLVDLGGRPVCEGGITDLRFVFEPLPPRKERIVH